MRSPGREEIERKPKFQAESEVWKIGQGTRPKHDCLCLCHIWGVREGWRMILPQLFMSHSCSWDISGRVSLRVSLSRNSQGSQFPWQGAKMLRPPPHPYLGSVDKRRVAATLPWEVPAPVTSQAMKPDAKLDSDALFPLVKGDPLPYIAVNTASLTLSQLAAYWPFPVLSPLQLARIFCFPQSSESLPPAPDLAHPAQSGCLMYSDSGRPGHLSVLLGVT